METATQPSENSSFEYGVLSGSSLELAKRTAELEAASGKLKDQAAASAFVDATRLGVTEAELLWRGTELQAIFRALRQSEERCRTLMEAIDDAIHIKDRDGRYLIVNAEMALRLGRSKEEIIGKTSAELHGAASVQEIGEEDRRVLEEGIAVDVESHFPGWQRAQVCHVRKLPLRSYDGSIIGVVTVSRDITRRKELEDQLLRAQRLETAGRIAGQVAHDFNNLLAPLTAYPELIKRMLPADHPAQAFCDDMRDSALQMADINEDMLTLGRRGRIDLQPTDLNRLVQQATERLGGKLAQIALDLDLSADLLPVQGSPAQLLRVIANLLSNAVEAMNPSGLLQVRTENLYADQPMGNRNQVAIGEYVRLTVRDSGCGIPEEMADRVFEPFVTTKRSGERRGCGLGLSVVQAIVEDHNGYVDLESQVGVGTTFAVYLPVSRQLPTGAPAQEIVGGTEGILVVDDDQLQREVGIQLLGTLGYQVQVAASGEEAVARIGEQAPDLLLLDMIMPGGIDGAETYRQAVERHPGLRALVLSGYSESERVKLARELGAGGYLRKPVTLEKLARAVRSELDRR